MEKRRRGKAGREGGKERKGERETLLDPVGTAHKHAFWQNTYTDKNLSK